VSENRSTRPAGPTRPTQPPRPSPTVDEVIRRYVLARLKANGGSKRATAAECGVALKTLYNWLQRWQEMEWRERDEAARREA